MPSYLQRHDYRPSAAIPTEARDAGRSVQSAKKLGENTLRKWGQIKMFKDRREQKWTEVITSRPTS